MRGSAMQQRAQTTLQTKRQKKGAKHGGFIFATSRVHDAEAAF
jgi:hypothetical protein